MKKIPEKNKIMFTIHPVFGRLKMEPSSVRLLLFFHHTFFNNQFIFPKITIFECITYKNSLQIQYPYHSFLHFFPQKTKLKYFNKFINIYQIIYSGLCSNALFFKNKYNFFILFIRPLAIICMV